MTPADDLIDLLVAIDPKAPQTERHLVLIRLLQWIRGAPRPIDRLHELLDTFDRKTEARGRMQLLMAAFWREVDAAALFADFGFGNRLSLPSEINARVRRRFLPRTPETADLAELFELLFEDTDGTWLNAMDSATVQRVAAIVGAPDAAWRQDLLEAITIVVSAVHASGYSPALRQRMDRSLLTAEPFRHLTMCSNGLRRALHEGQPEQVLQQANLLRSALDACRRAADTVSDHLEAYGVSANIVYEVDQLNARTRRAELLLDCVLSPTPQADLLRLLRELLQVSQRQRGVRAVLARHYSLLARLVAERNAETGTHYITRDRAEYRAMLRDAAGGGAVIAGTTFLKFAIAALGLSAFWTGFWSGANYALSFVVVMLLHWTVATKQPAMTAPALADSLPRDDDDASLQAFVDRVAQLIRSQVAGIVGNLAACAPLVILAQVLATYLSGAPLVGAESGEYVLKSITLLGPTALFAAFTGVLLFASSLIAGWAENWFVFHRLDSAIAWNPRIVARLGPDRAQRWARWSRQNVSGLAANISLGMLLGLTPAVLGFIGLPIEVRHVTLSTGQLAAAAGALGTDVLTLAPFWWCVAGIAITGVLNVTVSFWLAFIVALRSRGIQVSQRSRIYAAIRRRLVTRPQEFILPGR